VSPRKKPTAAEETRRALRAEQLQAALDRRARAVTDAFLERNARAALTPPRRRL
jgi:hypothetical protein